MGKVAGDRRHVCQDGIVAYEYDADASQEAARHGASRDELTRLGALCARKAEELGDDGVRGHRVTFSVTAWDQLPGLPEAILNSGRISRSDVLDLGEQVLGGTLSPVALLAASFIWGTGTTGYGPRRYREIVAAAGSRLEPSLRRVLAEINKDPDCPDPIAGYAQLYGGHDYKGRAAAGRPPWSRLHRFGPAFFTKFLYFSTPGALILDNRLANAVSQCGDLPYLVTTDGRSLAWTPYRYAVYLHWMRQTADSLGVSPGMLEVTLFRPPADPLGEQEAAD